MAALSGKHCSHCLIIWLTSLLLLACPAGTQAYYTMFLRELAAAHLRYSHLTEANQKGEHDTLQSNVSLLLPMNERSRNTRDMSTHTPDDFFPTVMIQLF
jgi:hypothetical protein